MNGTRLNASSKPEVGSKKHEGLKIFHLLHQTCYLLLATNLDHAQPSRRRHVAAETPGRYRDRRRIES